MIVLLFLLVLSGSPQLPAEARADQRDVLTGCDQDISACAELIEAALFESGTVGAVVVCNTCEETRGRTPGGDYLFRVSHVRANSPAELAGMVTGDIIVEVNNRRFRDRDSMAKLHESLRVGETVLYTILRNQKQLEIRVLTGKKDLETLDLQLYTALKRKYGAQKAEREVVARTASRPTQREPQE